MGHHRGPPQSPRTIRNTSTEHRRCGRLRHDDTSRHIHGAHTCWISKIPNLTAKQTQIQIAHCGLQLKVLGGDQGHIAQWHVHCSQGTSTSACTRMGDHQRRPSGSVNLVRICDRSSLRSRHRAEASVREINQPISIDRFHRCTGRLNRDYAP